MARRVARELMEQGALAVVLTGSRARGDHSEHSDVDLVAVGHGGVRGLSRRGGFLVSVNWATAAAIRRSFRDPELVGTEVPGWREAIILADPDGVAARLQRQAEQWTWESIDAQCDAWVAAQFTGWAEEVHKLVAMLERPAPLAVAVQRLLLAVRLAPIVAVRRRILYGTENRLWDLVAEAMGARWAAAQRAALGVGGEQLREGSRAALQLYVLTADEVWPLLDRRQRAVVAHARELAASRADA